MAIRVVIDQAGRVVIDQAGRVVIVEIPDPTVPDTQRDTLLIKWAKLTLKDTEIGFYRSGQARPTAAPAISEPWLESAGEVRRIARASHLTGIGEGESANTSVSLQNARGQLSALFENRLPHGDRIIQYDQLDNEVFSGFVSDVSLNPLAQLDVVAYSLTDVVPLRTTAEWGEYREVRAIPECYGDLSAAPVECIAYDNNREFWCPSNGAVEVVGVQIDEQVSSAWEAQATIDEAGETITLIRLGAPAPEGSIVTATVIGHRHPATGELIDTPAMVIWHLLTQVAERSLDLSDLETLRTETAGMKIGGQLRDNTITLRAQIDEIMRGCGCVWTWGMWRLYPPIDANITPDYRRSLEAIDLLNRDDPRLSSRGDDIATAVTVNYGYAPGLGTFTESITRSALDSPFDDRPQPHPINSRWLRHSVDADHLARRMCERLSRLRLSGVLSISDPDVAPGDWLRLIHSRIPGGAGDAFVLGSILRGVENQLSIEVTYGPVPVTRISARSVRSATPEAGGIEVSESEGVVTLTVFDADGKPAPGAEVTLDNGPVNVADSAGKVTFSGVKSGRHIVRWVVGESSTSELEISV